MSSLYPLRFDAALREKIWGSADLRPFYGRKDKPVGEAWFSFEENVVANGDLEGDTLGEVTERLGAALLGSSYRSSGLRRTSVGERAVTAPGAYFPVLAKLLFTSAKLSVQVHPDDAQAKLESGGAGKAEMWYVVDAKPGACVNAGLTSALSEQELVRTARSGDIENHLRWVEVRAGDVVHIPPGTLHTIGAGLTICEIQQNSDLTYRFFDFGRLDDQGNPRPLHIEEAAKVTRVDQRPVAMRGVRLPAEGFERRLLTACDYFTAESLAINSRADLVPGGESFELLVFLQGSGSIGGQPYEAGVAYLLPAALESAPVRATEATKADPRALAQPREAPQRASGGRRFERSHQGGSRRRVATLTNRPARGCSRHGSSSQPALGAVFKTVVRRLAAKVGSTPTSFRHSSDSLFRLCRSRMFRAFVRSPERFYVPPGSRSPDLASERCFGRTKAQQPPDGPRP